MAATNTEALTIHIPESYGTTPEGPSGVPGYNAPAGVTNFRPVNAAQHVEYQENFEGADIVQIDRADGIFRLVEDRQPWERQPGEKDVAWEAFRIYRDMMPANRTLAAVYRKVAGEQAAKPGSPLYGVAVKYLWKERVEAYDRWVEKRILHELEHRRLTSRIETARMGAQMREVVVRAIADLMRCKEVVDSAGETHIICRFSRPLSPSDIARLADIGVKVERTALGFGDDDGGTRVNVGIVINADDRSIRAQAREVLESQQSIADVTYRILEEDE